MLLLPVLQLVPAARAAEARDVASSHALASPAGGELPFRPPASPLPRRRPCRTALPCTPRATAASAAAPVACSGSDTVKVRLRWVWIGSGACTKVQAAARSARVQCPAFDGRVCGVVEQHGVAWDAVDVA